MKYDLEKILLVVKNDEEWIKKLLIGSLFLIALIILIFIPIISVFLFKKLSISLMLFLVCYIGAVVIGLALNGYGLQTAHDYINNPQTKLPDWRNFWSLTFVGFKSVLGSILFFLPVILLGAVAAVFEAYLKSHTAVSEGFKTTYFIYNIFAQFIYFAYTALYYLFNANFIKEFNLFEFLNVAEAYKSIKGNVLSYCILVLLVIAMGILLNIIGFVLVLTIIGIILVPFISIYVQIVCCVLTARFVQITQESQKL